MGSGNFRPRPWTAEWVYELEDGGLDRGVWTGEATSAEDATAQIARYVDRICGSGGTLAIGALRAQDSPAGRRRR